MERMVIITGLSGSGKTLAGNCLEDLGFFCVDNLPVQLIPQFFDLLQHSKPAIERAALVVDIREAGFLGEFPDTLARLRESDVPLELLFFECSEEAQKRRFSETRRPHPMAAEMPSLEAAIRAERQALEAIRNRADRIIDTTDFTVHRLRAFLKNAYATEPAEGALNVNLLSFGFKYGLPPEADLVFDVRFLPNPYFVDALRPLTGRDEPVRGFVDGQSETPEFRRRLEALLDYLIPLYAAEGKSYLTIAIGCTGGKHRSVAVAEAIAERLRTSRVRVAVNHRDIGND